VESCQTHKLFYLTYKHAKDWRRKTWRLMHVNNFNHITTYKNIVDIHMVNETFWGKIIRHDSTNNCWFDYWAKSLSIVKTNNLIKIVLVTEVFHRSLGYPSRTFQSFFLYKPVRKTQILVSWLRNNIPIFYLLSLKDIRQIFEY